ncbi:hypothetical protein CTAYLR_003875 [Chrysophaeum taylorii]|uniref:Calmodulin n=1 Tax=Chrysophaeum taylorii TaxID=2483200 RepID=A0AAD7XQA1_9STRA|nr:hypothetical protein CTAYLR_003875 [Chrysophaeum taylorii]
MEKGGTTTESEGKTKSSIKFARALGKLKPMKRLGDATKKRAGSLGILGTEARSVEKEDCYEDFRSDEAVWRFLKSPFLGPAYQQRLMIGRLSVKVIEAANLPAADLGGTSDPYVKLILTGRNKWDQEWDHKQTWRTKTVKKDLCPRFHAETTFGVPRFDAVLRVEVYDSDVQSADDLLGSCEVPLKELAGRGLVKNWFSLKIETGFTAPSAAVHVHLHYDVSPLGEAVSMVWCEQRNKVEKPKFDINAMITNGLKLKDEMQPYLDFANAGERSTRWVDCEQSRRWLAALLFLACFIHRLFEIVHVGIAIALLRNYLEKRHVERIKKQAADIFEKIDRDGSKSLDRSEIGMAVRELAMRTSRKPPSEAETDELFSRADVDGGGELCLEEFTQMLLESPSIMGVNKVLHHRISSAEEAAAALQGDVDDDDDDGDDEPVDERQPHQRQQQQRQKRASTSAFARMMRSRRTNDTEDSQVSRTPAAANDDDDKQQQKGVVIKGMTAKIVNMVARKVGGPAADDGMKQLGDAVKAMELVRAIFQWDDPKVSATCVVANVAMAAAHYMLPLAVFAVPAVLGAFFAMSEKRKMLEIFVDRGAKAVARYQFHLRRHKGEPNKILEPKMRPILQQIATGPIFGSSVSTKAYKAVVHSIFSRLDVDGSGTIDSHELCSFVLQAMPSATPRVREQLGGDEATVERRVSRLVDKYDVNGDGEIDFSEFAEIVAKTGTAEVLIQDELNRQIKSEAGMKCIKLPSTKTALTSPKLWAHQTSLVAKPAKLSQQNVMRSSTDKKFNLSYTSRHGDTHVITAQCLLDVRASPSSKQVICVTYKEFPDAKPTKALLLRLSEVLRDPFLDLLRTNILRLPQDSTILKQPRTYDREISELSKNGGGGGTTRANSRAAVSPK